MDLEQAKNLKIGQIIYHNVLKNWDGSSMRFKVNGKVKTWKTRPGCVKVPLKHGLRDYRYLTEMDLINFSLAEK